MQNRNVLVTGAGGFLGLALTKELLAQGVAVRSLNRNSYDSLTELGVEQIIGDLQNPDDVDRAVAGVDAVFHVASKTGIWGSYKSYAGVNITGTENIIAACKKQGVKELIYTSTPSVVFDRGDICGGDESLPYPQRFLCHYAATKARAEELLLAANSDELKTVALRPHLIWGPGDTNLIPRLIAKGRAKQLKKVGDCSNRVDIIYVDNAAKAHIQAWQNLQSSGSAAGKAYFISQGEPVNLWSWVDELFAKTEVPAIKSRVSFRAAYAIGSCIEGIYHLLGKKSEPPMTRFIAMQLAKSHYFDMGNATKDFGYSAEISTAEGLELTAAWVRESL